MTRLTDAVAARKKGLWDRGGFKPDAAKGV